MITSFYEDPAGAAAWAKLALTDRDLVILDTETTGLEWDAEIIEIAAVDCTGDVLMHTHLRPIQPIPPGAIAIHGIHNRDVAGAWSFPSIYDRLVDLFRRHVVIYNRDYDCPRLENGCRIWGLPLLDTSRVDCAMLLYAAFHGEWSEYHGNYKWQRLEGAAYDHGFDFGQFPAHSALGDCLATLHVIRAMAGEVQWRWS